MEAFEEISGQLHTLSEILLKKNLKLTTAESCTGGWVAKLCTDLAGSSAWFDRGFVTYSNEAKMEMLAVSAATLDKYGAVSEQTTAEMASGAITHSHGDVAVSISGIAGPTGGSAEKPVGMVCFGWAINDDVTETATLYFEGDRDQVRRQAVVAAVEGLLKLVQ